MTRPTMFWLTALACTTVAFGLGAQGVQTSSPPTMAPSAPGPADPAKDPASLERLDANNDGRITKAEAQKDPELARRFSELDTDRSGKLDRGEFARFEVGGETSPTDARARGGISAGSDSDAQPRERDAR